LVQSVPPMSSLSRERYATVSVLCLLFLACGLRTVAAAQEFPIPDYIKTALASPARTDADRKADMTRKPGELLAFAGVKPGDKVLELVPGRGYWEKLFSLIVGPKGHVYELVSDEEIKSKFTKPEPIKAIAADPAFSNVTVFTQPIATVKPPEPVDLVWTVQNYHDLHDIAFGPADIPTLDKSIFAALKPGGAFFINDHDAAPGHGVSDTQTLHRIEPSAAIAEVEAAGFKLEVQSDVLKNPDDDHKLKIFDPKIRGKTDKFTVLFRKPS
jgi:predicted methyltransferase